MIAQTCLCPDPHCALHGVPVSATLTVSTADQPAGEPNDYVRARDIRERVAAPDQEPLLPCPYCGEKESDGNLELDDCGDEPAMFIRCLWCGTMGPHTLADGDEPPENQTEQQARAAWNKRAESAAPVPARECPDGSCPTCGQPMGAPL